MDDMLRAAQRGWDLLFRAAVPLLVGGLVWTGLNLLTAGLLAGPALVGLFVVAFKTHQGRRAEIADLFAAFDDVAAPLLAGIVFILPFQLSAYLRADGGGLPLIVPIFLAAWFAIGIHVFAALADRPEDRLSAAWRRSWQLAESGGRGRVSGMALHLLYGLGVFLLIGLGDVLPTIGGLTRVLTLPVAACLITAWHVHLTLPSEPTAESGGAPELLEAEEAQAEPGPAPKPVRKARKKTPSRRPAAARDGET